MAGSKNNGPNDINWKSFEQFFGGKLPFSAEGGEPMSWVENYVKDVLKQAMPASISSTTTESGVYHSELFETHNSVILKIHIPDRIHVKNASVLVGDHQVRLDHLPGKGSQTFRLPSLVLPGSCRAVYKNGVLQLHMRKQSGGDYYTRVDVRFP